MQYCCTCRMHIHADLYSLEHATCIDCLQYPHPYDNQNPIWCLHMHNSLRNRYHPVVRNGLLGKPVDEALFLWLTGNTPIQLRGYFELLFEDGMTWENASIWHIDHIQPISSFDLCKNTEIRKCWHWHNLQPLFGLENISKGNYWCGDFPWYARCNTVKKVKKAQIVVKIKDDSYVKETLLKLLPPECITDDLIPEKVCLLGYLKSGNDNYLSFCGKKNCTHIEIIYSILESLGVHPANSGFIGAKIPVQRIEDLFATGGIKADLETLFGIKILQLTYRSYIAKLHMIFDLFHLDIERIRVTDKNNKSIISHYIIRDPFNIWNQLKSLCK